MRPDGTGTPATDSSATVPHTSKLRIGAGAFDQVLSSASNVLAIMALARTSGVVEFGQLSLVYAFMATCLAVSRGFFGTLISLSSGADTHLLPMEAARAAVTVAGAGTVFAACIFVPFAMIFDVTSASLSLILPVVLVQDTCRYYFIAAREPQAAIASDGLWAIGSASLLLVTWLQPEFLGPGSVVLLWSSLGSMALAIAWWRARLPVHLNGLKPWIAQTFKERVHFGSQAALASISSLVVVTVASSFLGVVAISALRGASTLLGPLGVLNTAMALVLVPELSRGSREPRQLWRKLRGPGRILTIMALAIGTGLFLLPASLGHLLLGDTWGVARPLIPITCLEYAALAWWNCAGTALSVLHRSRDLLTTRLVMSVSSVVFGGTIGLLTHDARGVAAGLVIAAMVAAASSRQYALRGAEPGALGVEQPVQETRRLYAFLRPPWQNKEKRL